MKTDFQSRDEQFKSVVEPIFGSELAAAIQEWADRTGESLVHYVGAAVRDAILEKLKRDWDKLGASGPPPGPCINLAGSATLPVDGCAALLTERAGESE